MLSAEAAIATIVPVRAGAALELTLDGRSVLAATVAALRTIGGLGRIVLALDGLGPDVILAAVPDAESAEVVIGPRARGYWDSIEAVLPLLGTAQRIVLHAPDRPMVSAAAVNRLLAAGGAAAVAGLAVNSSIKRGVDGRVVATVPRETVRTLQGPWRFDRGAFEDAVRRATSEDWSPGALTLARRAGIRVTVVEGDDLNVAVTSAADARFVALALARNRTAGSGSSGEPG